MFSENLNDAKKGYKKFLQCVDSQKVLDFYNKKNLTPFFGSTDFIERIKDKYRKNKEHYEVPQAKQLALTITEIKRVVSQSYDIEVEDMEQTKRGSVNEPRNVAIYIARKYTGLRLEEIGHAFGLRKYSSVSSVVCRTGQQLVQNKKLKNRVDKIKQKLQKSQAKT